MKLFRWLSLFFTFFVILFIYHYPTLLAAYTTPPQSVYLMQNSYFDPWDMNIYVSAISYGQTAGLLFPNLYTTTSPNPPVLIFTFSTLTGFLFKSANPFLLFHLSAIGMGILLLFSMFFAIKSFGFSFLKSLLLVFLISLGGGFGFFGSSIGAADWNESSFTFYTTFQKGHEGLAMLSFILSLTFFYHLCVSETKRLQKTIFTTVFLCIALFVYPYLLISFGAITFLFLLIIFEKNIQPMLIRWVGMVTAGVIVAAVSSYQFMLNPTFAGIGSTLTLSIISAVLGFGFLIPLFLYYLFFLPKSKLGILLSLWIIIPFLLGVFPLGPGKIFFRGSFFPIIIVGFMALELIMQKKEAIYAYMLYPICVLVLLGTSLYIFNQRLSFAYSTNQWLYISKEEFSILQFLDAHTKPQSGVLTYYRLSNLIPAFTKNRVYFGHTRLTPDGEEKVTQAASFVAGTGTIGEKKMFLQKSAISYIIWGPSEQELLLKNPNAQNQITVLLKTFPRVYTTKNYSIYHVQ